MSKKVKILLPVLIFWVSLFIAWEWWKSYPKVRSNPTLKVTTQSEGIDSILNQALSTYLLPGISVAIVKDDKVRYLNALGFENLETKDSLTVESRILVASVSKLFTALGMAVTLQDKGIFPNSPIYSLGLGKEVDSSYLTNLKVQDLLSHRSGIRDKSFSERIFSFSKPQTLNEWGLEFLEKPSIVGEDSFGYLYADSNYDLLGFLVSNSADFDSLFQSSVFAPSGMLNTSYISSWPIEENGITGYQKTFLWKRIQPKRISFPILPSPSSGLITTTKDMSSALLHFLRGETGAYKQALNWLSIEENEAPLGFQKMRFDETDWYGHFGGQAGYSSFLFFSREASTGIFLFSNSIDREEFRISIARDLISYISP